MNKRDKNVCSPGICMLEKRNKVNKQQQQKKTVSIMSEGDKCNEERAKNLRNQH